MYGGFWLLVFALRVTGNSNSQSKHSHNDNIISFSLVGCSNCAVVVMTYLIQSCIYGLLLSTGEVIETVKKLQSLEFLDKVWCRLSFASQMQHVFFSQLEGDKRKSAIKLNKNQKRKAIVELFKYLKKQGTIHKLCVLESEQVG